MPFDHREPHSGLQTERGRQRLLQVCAASHHGIAMLLCEIRETVGKRCEISTDAVERGAHLQNCRGVDDVLRRRAPMQIPARVADLLLQLMDHADNWIPDKIGFHFQFCEVKFRRI